MFPLRRPLAAALFLATASALAQTHVTLVPQAATLLPGRSLAFKAFLAFGREGTPVTGGRREALAMPQEDWEWRILDGGVGDLEPRTGVYTAPVVDRPHTVKVQVRCRPCGHLAADAMVLLLPHEPFDVVAKVLGPDWLEPYRGDQPFRDPATNRRPEGKDSVQEYEPSRPRTAAFYGAWGLPLTLRWPCPLGTQAQQLHGCHGGALFRRDVTGWESAVLTPTALLERFTVESLQRVPDREDTWWSLLQTYPIHLRGLFPFAGNAVAPAGHFDGTGLAARFREPFGVAGFKEDDEGGNLQEGFLVSDAATHVVRRVDLKGRVRTLWGMPDEAGHLDAIPARFLDKVSDTLLCRYTDRTISHFNRPTFLAVHPYRHAGQAMTWWCAVADSGNHVVRVLHPDGCTRTLAGVPGQAGHRDGKPALFNDPQGLAVDAWGNVYVADRGNHVIRLIRPDGQVETLAGRPGERGDRDGQGEAARFADLRGLALTSPEGWPCPLYLLDGHALRRLTVPGGVVETLAGKVGTAGFREVQGGTPEERTAALREPCLDLPCGLVAHGQAVALAELGNHAVRRFDPGQRTLTTLAGDRGSPRLRWGLTRDGLEVPLDDRYATLEAPRTLATLPREGILVTTGTCLAVLWPSMQGRDRLGAVELTCPSASVLEPCVARFALRAWDPGDALVQRAIHYTVDFLEADGTLAQRQRGTGVSSDPVAAVGTFQQRGAGMVVVRCVSDQGVSAGGQVQVQVR